MKARCSFSKFIRYSSFLVIIGCLTACETAVPDDMMFCKSEEVYVLEEPFEEKSAIIVMYRGDDLRLLGDTIYQQAIELDTKVDSSIFFVKVKAKRGVIGWVHCNDLQHDRPKIQTKRPKKSVVIEKIKKPEPIVATVDSSLIGLDTTVVLSDSLFAMWMGSYHLALDSNNVSDLLKITCSQKDSISIQFEVWRTNSEDCNLNFKGSAKLRYNEAIYKKDSCNLQFRFIPPYLEVKQISSCNKIRKNGCDLNYKLKKGLAK